MSIRGFSVLVAIFALMVLLLYVTVASQLIAPESEEVGHTANAERALFVAEGGLNVTELLLKDNWESWTNDVLFPDQDIDGGTFSITLADDDDGDGNLTSDTNGTLIVTVTGTMGDASRTIRAEVDRYGPALMSGVYAGGDVSGEGQVTGDVVDNGDEVPGLDVAAAITAAQANLDNGYATRPDGNYFQGDFPGGSDQPESLNGVIYIDRFGDGSLADVHLSSNLSTTASDPAFMIIIGDLHISGSVVFHGLLYIAGGAVDVDVGGSVQIDGGVITTGSVEFDGSADLTYVAGNVITDTTTSLLTGIGGPHTTTWEEVIP
ncbi:MAG: hypothetical protein HY465_04820 [Deltaproteobacteria bacterium]|nr:hypothetical protein [Deltaproteobacteria bacterium]